LPLVKFDPKPTLVAAGRTAFAVSLIAFAVQQLLFGDFVPGRAPGWPAGIPGRLLWAYASAGVLFAAGAAVLVTATDGGHRYRRAARLASLSVGMIICLWALVRHVPAVMADTQFGGAWTNAGKALCLSGGALAVGASLAPERRGDQGTRAFIYLGRACLGIFLINSGIQHFLWEDFVTTLVPSWIPGALFWTYFAGVALVAGGVGLLVPRFAPLAGTLVGAMVFTWVLILHVPRALTAPEAGLRNEWIAVFEALAVSGLAFVVARLPPASVR
jgi:uncharacterized membrane protein YphA (DoxX/SURF4 family)